jgi:hypothetical protein
MTDDPREFSIRPDYPIVVRFMVETSAADMPLGDGSIEGPLYTKGFPTAQQARDWCSKYGAQLRMYNIAIYSTNPADQPGPPLLEGEEGGSIH